MKNRCDLCGEKFPSKYSWRVYVTPSNKTYHPECWDTVKITVLMGVHHKAVTPERKTRKKTGGK